MPQRCSEGERQVALAAALEAAEGRLRGKEDDTSGLQDRTGMSQCRK